MNGPIDIYQGQGPRALMALPGDRAEAEPADRLDLRRLLTTLRRRMRLSIMVAIAVVTLVMVWSLTRTPSYSAQAQVALNTTVERVAPTGSDRDPATVPNDTVAETEAQVIASREMAGRVADALALDGDPRFNPLIDARPPLRQRLLGMVGIGGDRAAAPPTPVRSREAVLDRLQRGLTVQRIGTSLAFSLGFETEDAAMAARIVNEYARRYTLGQLDAKKRINHETRDFLSRRLDELRAQANADNERVQRYRVAAGLLSTSGASLTEQEISAYNQGATQARAQAAEDQARLDTARAQLRSGSTGDDVGEALGSGVVSALRSQQSGASAQLANLRARYGRRHPDVLKAESELREIDNTIEAEIRRVISNLEAKATVSRERLASISGSLAGARGTLAQNNRAMVTLDDLNRRAEASQALYESYLNRFKETSAQEGAERSDARILTLAEVPTKPSSPNTRLHLALALALGAALGLIAALLAETLFAGVTTGEEVESRLGVRHLGGIPHLSSLIRRGTAPIDAVVQAPHGAFAEAFRTLRATLPYAVAGPVQVVAVTSALPQEGKTTLAICLARLMALSGEGVVLVDCDLRRRSTSLALDDGAGRPGLVEVLEGDATLDQALMPDPASGAQVLRIDHESARAAALIQGPAMDALLDDLRARFPHVVLDTPPLLPIAYARLLAAKADAAIMAVRWRRTADHAARAALRLLPAAHVRLAGVVLTQVDMRKQRRFGHGDATSYHADYKGYYA